MTLQQVFSNPIHEFTVSFYPYLSSTSNSSSICNLVYNACFHKQTQKNVLIGMKHRINKE